MLNALVELTAQNAMNQLMYGVLLIKIAQLFVLLADNIMIQIQNNVLIVKLNCVLFVMERDSSVMDVRMGIIPSN